MKKKNIKDLQTDTLILLLWLQNEYRMTWSSVTFRSALILWASSYWETSPSTWWSVAGTDEPPPSWLSVIWRFIKVRGSCHACVNGGFFYFMESLISRGSLASTQIPVLTNAAAGLCTQCASSSSSPLLNASHDKQGDPITLPKCVSGGVGHSITEGGGSLPAETVRHMWPSTSFPPWLSVHLRETTLSLRLNILHVKCPYRTP